MRQVDRDSASSVLSKPARQAISKPFPSKTHIGDHPLHPETCGTETLLAKMMAGLSIGAVGFADGLDEAAVRRGFVLRPEVHVMKSSETPDRMGEARETLARVPIVTGALEASAGTPTSSKEK